MKRRIFNLDFGINSVYASYPHRSIQIHKVSKGEALSTIARKHSFNGVKAIASINGLSAPRYALREGQILRVSICDA